MSLIRLHLLTKNNIQYHLLRAWSNLSLASKSATHFDLLPYSVTPGIVNNHDNVSRLYMEENVYIVEYAEICWIEELIDNKLFPYYLTPD